jgi:predicted HTH domain antitoxin
MLKWIRDARNLAFLWENFRYRIILCPEHGIGMKGWKVNIAIKTFRQGKVSLWKASVKAGLSLREFIEVLDESKVDWVGVSLGDLEAEVRAIGKEVG